MQIIMQTTIGTISLSLFLVTAPAWLCMWFCLSVRLFQSALKSLGDIVDRRRSDFWSCRAIFSFLISSVLNVSNRKIPQCLVDGRWFKIHFTMCVLCWGTKSFLPANIRLRWMWTVCRSNLDTADKWSEHTRVSVAHNVLKSYFYVGRTLKLALLSRFINLNKFCTDTTNN